jgi:hypothetical protein
MLSLRQLQTEVNALLWRHDNYTTPNDATRYQETAVVALQSGFSIEGRDAPYEGGITGRTTVTHFTRPHHPDRTLSWQPNNASFTGEPTIGTMGCYICGGGHFTSEHAVRQHRYRSPPADDREEQQPPPNYPDTVRTQGTAAAALPTAFELLPNGPVPPPPNNGPTLTLFDRRGELPPITPRRHRMRSPRTPYDNQDQSRVRPRAMRAPSSTTATTPSGRRMPLEQRIEDPRRTRNLRNSRRPLTQHELRTLAGNNDYDDGVDEHTE